MVVPGVAPRRGKAVGIDAVDVMRAAAKDIRAAKAEVLRLHFALHVLVVAVRRLA